MKPIGSNVIIKPGNRIDEKTESGLYIPFQKTGRIPEGIVIAIGEEVETIKIGDTVLYPDHSITEFEHEKEKYELIHELNIMAKVEK